MSDDSLNEESVSTESSIDTSDVEESIVDKGSFYKSTVDKIAADKTTTDETVIDDNPYLTNPLHGVGLKTVLHELVSHYGFDILYAYLNINCFRSNPSLSASEKFLKKTDWAREKVEVFYLYQYKNLPKVSSEQFKLPPRERVVPEKHKPGEPAILSIEDGERLQEKRSKNAASRNSHTGERKGSSREYNEQRSAGHYKFRKDSNKDSNKEFNRGSSNQSSGDSPYKKSRNDSQDKPSYYKSDDNFSSDNSDNAPAPPKDPWGNFKGGK